MLPKLSFLNISEYPYYQPSLVPNRDSMFLSDRVIYRTTLLPIRIDSVSRAVIF